MVYGCFLKQLPVMPSIKAVKHPSVIKKVDCARPVTELWGTSSSDDNEEDQILKKPIANCSYGMLEKQVNQKVKSKIFDTYEDAKFFQLKYGGDILHQAVRANNNLQGSKFLGQRCRGCRI